MIIRVRLTASCIATLAMLSACSSLSVAEKNKISDVAKKFNDVVADSRRALVAEEGAKSAVRRSEAVMYWVANGDDESNLSRASPEKSFGQYVCTGAGALSNAHAFFDYAQAYGKSLDGILAPAGDSFAKQWKKLLESRSLAAGPAVKEPSSADKAFDACVTNVRGALNFRGVRARDTTDESAAAVIAAFQAFQEVLKALDKVATDSLKLANEVEARRRFSAFVVSQHEYFAGALSQHLSPEALDNAWNRRSSAALWRPYLTFNEMMRKPRTEAREIAALASRLQSELAEYDELRKAPPPSRVVEAIAKAEASLYDMATNESVPVSSVLAFLRALASEVAQIRSDYADLKSKVDALGKGDSK